METIVKDAHAAYGVNSHFWFRSKDGKSLFVLEQYEDKKALRKAIRRFTSARISFFRSIKVIDVAVYGSISKSSELMFAVLKPQYMDYYGGYSRNETKAQAQEAGIKNFERNRILIAMNATFKDEEKCKVAMEGVVKHAYTETGTNSHFWCRSKDGKALFVLEQYADEKALLEHVMANPPSRAAFFESIEVVDVTVYGTVSDKIKEMFAPLNPTYMNYYGGYSK
jgi:quinol monooxygenase YgiN